MAGERLPAQAPRQVRHGRHSSANENFSRLDDREKLQLAAAVLPKPVRAVRIEAMLSLFHTWSGRRFRAGRWQGPAQMFFYYRNARL